jgi:hypothetical protein
MNPMVVKFIKWAIVLYIFWFVGFCNVASVAITLFSVENIHHMTVDEFLYIYFPAKVLSDWCAFFAFIIMVPECNIDWVKQENTITIVTKSQVTSKRRGK